MWQFDNKVVKRVYSGRKGCACGCRGRYYENGQRGFSTVLKRIEELLFVDSQIEVGEVMVDEEWIAVDLADVSRTYTVYFN